MIFVYRIVMIYPYQHQAKICMNPFHWKITIFWQSLLLFFAILMLLFSVGRGTSCEEND